MHYCLPTEPPLPLLLLLVNGGLETTCRCIPPPTVQECVTSRPFDCAHIPLINPVLLRNVNDAFLEILIPSPSPPEPNITHTLPPEPCEHRSFHLV